MKRRNFSTVRKIAKGVRVNHQDLLKFHPLDPFAEKIMENLEGKVDNQFINLFKDLVRGFDEDMQIEMADNLHDFARSHVANTTGLVSADMILDICYKMIAIDHDILKKCVRSRIINKVRV